MLYGKTRIKFLSSGIIQITMTLILLCVVAGCTLNRMIPTISPLATQESIDVWIDANTVMSGICFESAFDAAGTVFILRDDAQLSNFFDLADNSHLCRRPVQRHPFEFNTGRILVGMWSKGRGCTARHDITRIERDDDARTFTIVLKFITEGACPYELVRPFWIGVHGISDYQISLVVE
jgi:hypothetical protein